MEQVELKAPETILNKGVKIPVSAPLLLRIFGKKYLLISVPDPSINTYAQCAIYYLKIGLTAEQSLVMDFTDLLKICSGKSHYANRLVARAILNSSILGWLFTKPLGWYLGGHAKFKDLLLVAQIIVIQGGLEDFTNFIGLAQKMNIMSQTSQQSSPTS